MRRPTWTLRYTHEDGWTVPDAWNVDSLTNDDVVYIHVTQEHDERTDVLEKVAAIAAKHEDPEEALKAIETLTRAVLAASERLTPYTGVRLTAEQAQDAANAKPGSKGWA